MIKEIKVVNRFGAKSILTGLKPVPTSSGIVLASTPVDKWGIISINCSDEPFLIEEKGVDMKRLEKTGLDMVMSIRFDDIRLCDYEKIKLAHPDIILFNEDHARKIIEFVSLAQRRLDPMTLLIHCTAGISRSGAVATFISEYLNISFHDEMIVPNPYILEILRKTA